MKGKDMKSFLISIAIVSALAAPLSADVKLPALVSDNMVLQRGVELPIWGWADPGEQVTVSFLGQTTSVAASRDGRWKAVLSPLTATSAAEMTVRGKNVITVRNVAVGEVWLVAGDWNLKAGTTGQQAEDFQKEGPKPMLRIFIVPAKVAVKPGDAFVGGKWVECRDNHVVDFLGTAGFFSREIYRHLQVPVGIVQCLAGGKIETWMDARTLESLDKCAPERKLLDFIATPEGQKAYEAAVRESGDPEEPENTGFGLGYANAEFDDSSWTRISYPRYGMASGTQWSRKEIQVPVAWAGKDLTVSLGELRDYDISYFNGVKIGSMGPESPNASATIRHYTVPGNLVKAGRNVISFRIFRKYTYGGVGAKDVNMYVALASGDGSERLSLAGEWKTKVERVIDATGPKFVYVGDKQDYIKAMNAEDPGNKGLELGYARPDCDDAGWDLMSMPNYWEHAGLDMDGAVWFRREVTIPGTWADKRLTLALQELDDFDTTYFNGIEVGATRKDTPDAWNKKRRYTIPASLVKPGTNTIAVRIFDKYTGGGMHGSDLWLGPVDGDKNDKASLNGVWKYKVESVLERRYLSMPGPIDDTMATVLFNGMINPMRDYRFRGVLFSQGSGNVLTAREYGALFPALIGFWRQVFQNPTMPFIYEQSPIHAPHNLLPGQYAAYGQLRETQLNTLKLPNTAMVVAGTLGFCEDATGNVPELGRRFSLAALGTVYGETVVYSGPIYRAMKVEGDKIRISFEHVGSGLMLKGATELKDFVIAGNDMKFAFAQARIDGDSVVVWSPEVPSPVAVNYAYDQNPSWNLYNKEGLPASPFRTHP